MVKGWMVYHIWWSPSYIILLIHIKHGSNAFTCVTEYCEILGGGGMFACNFFFKVFVKSNTFSNTCSLSSVSHVIFFY